MPIVLVVLLFGAVAAGVSFGWPALLNVLKEANRPAPTPVRVPVAQPPPATPQQSQTFTQTGFTVSQPLLGFWRAYGGVPIFGYPISDVLTERSASSADIEVQYFERARLEVHREAVGTSDYVRTGTIGLEAPRPGTPLSQLPDGLLGDQVVLGAANIPVPEKFFNFWANSGGKLIFGEPVTRVLSETVGGVPLAVQYFQNARLEYHPEAAGTPGEITLGLLGAEIYRQKYQK
jgi:hypothetical protein